jgi:Tfp pilus assembly protein PilV
MLKRNLKGLSLLEVFLSAVIFVTSTAAIFLTLNVARKPAVNRDQSIGAALAIRNVFEDLRSKVSTSEMSAAGAYSTGDLTEGTHGPIFSGIYNIYYNVTTNAATGVRRVTANAVWTDAL